MDDTATLNGVLCIEVFGADGLLKDSRTVTNLVVTAGKNLIADRLMSSPTKGAISHMAIGTNTTAAAAGDTTLGTENARVALTSGTVSGAVATYVASFPAGTGTGTITEAGLLNANSVGDLLAHSVFTGIPKGGSDTLTITWTVTVS